MKCSLGQKGEEVDIKERCRALFRQSKKKAMKLGPKEIRGAGTVGSRKGSLKRRRGGTSL